MKKSFIKKFKKENKHEVKMGKGLKEIVDHGLDYYYFGVLKEGKNQEAAEIREEMTKMRPELAFLMASEQIDFVKNKKYKKEQYAMLLLLLTRFFIIQSKLEEVEDPKEKVGFELERLLTNKLVLVFRKLGMNLRYDGVTSDVMLAQYYRKDIIESVDYSYKIYQEKGLMDEEHSKSYMSELKIMRHFVPELFGKEDLKSSKLLAKRIKEIDKIFELEQI